MENKVFDAEKYIIVSINKHMAKHRIAKFNTELNTTTLSDIIGDMSNLISYLNFPFKTDDKFPCKLSSELAIYKFICFLLAIMSEKDKKLFLEEFRTSVYNLEDLLENRENKVIRTAQEIIRDISQLEYLYFMDIKHIDNIKIKHGSLFVYDVEKLYALSDILSNITYSLLLCDVNMDSYFVEKNNKSKDLDKIFS